MKKNWILAIVTVLTAVAVIGCGADKGSDNDRNKVTIGVVGEANEMWDPVIATMAEEGVDIELISFSEYAIPNRALNDGETDLNAFQHYAYFNNEIADNGYELEAIGDTFISAMNIYSVNVDSVDAISEGDKIALPNDVTNEGRALKVIEGAGLLTLDPEAGDTPELTDIVENPLNLELVEVDAANVYALMPDVAAAVINGNYAMDNGLTPGEDAIFQDNVAFYSGKNYVNLIAARKADVDNPVYKRIVEVYQSQEVIDVFNDTFKGSYVPAWQ